MSGVEGVQDVGCSIYSITELVAVPASGCHIVYIPLKPVYNEKSMTPAVLRL